MKKIICIIFSAVLICLSVLPVLGAEIPENSRKYVVDNADVLTASQEDELNKKLLSFREENKLDIVIVTAKGISPDRRMDYADDFFDYNGYGYGNKKDGVLLLINIPENGTFSENNAWISTHGKGINYLNDEEISRFGQEAAPMLKRGDFVGAFNFFQEYVKAEISASNKKTVIFIIVFALIAATAVAFIYTGSLRKKLKTVENACEADEYVKNDSLKITRSYDHFLYSNVTKVKKVKADTSTHTSSSGETHGGGGF